MLPLMNTLLESLAWVFSGLLRVSGQAVVMIPLLVLVQAVLGGKLSPHWRHALWLLVVVRLLVPVSIPSPVSLFNVVRAPAGAAPTGAALEQSGIVGYATPVRGLFEAARRGPAPKPGEVSPLPVTRRGAQTPAAFPEGAFTTGPAVRWTWLQRLALVWSGVALLLGLRLLVQNGRFRRRLAQDGSPADAKLQALLHLVGQGMGLRRLPRLVRTHQVPSPGLYGLWRPRLLIPSTLSRAFSEAELRYIFLHELAHWKRGDLVVNWFTTLAQVLHWFNPLVWLAFRRLRSERELAADTLALSQLESGEIRTYGHTILKMLDNLLVPTPLPGLVGIMEEKTQMKRRITMIANYRDTKRWPIIAVATFASLALVALTDAQSKSQTTKPPDSEATAAGPPASPAAVAGAGSPRLMSSSETGDVVDPKTGLKFRAVKTITGTNDVIAYDFSRMHLSPNGRFLLWRDRVVPLDGRPVFPLKELQGASSREWSPDGEKIAFVNSAGLSVLPVSPETGQPRGPAVKLFEGDSFRSKIWWSADSARILFVRWVGWSEGRQAASIDLRDGRINPQPDYADFGLVSPDGKTLAYCIPQDGIWTRPLPGGVPRIATSSGSAGNDLILWSADSQWVGSATGQPSWHTEEFHLGRPSDGQDFCLVPPEAVGSFIGKSADGNKLWFYRCSLEPQLAWKILRVSGEPAIKVSAPPEFGFLYSWFADSTSLTALGFTMSGAQHCWSIPFNQGQRVQFKTELLGTNSFVYSVSKDRKSMFYMVDAGTNQGPPRTDLYVAPISLTEARPTGPGTVIFRGWQNPGSGPGEAWSPDGTRIVVTHRGSDGNELWILSTDGRKQARIAQIPEARGFQPQWSPDGRLIAFTRIAADRKMLDVIPAEGGTPRTLLTTPEMQYVPFGWARDSKEVVVACDGVISGLPVMGGTARVILRLQDAGCEQASWLGWAPDGRALAFYGGKAGDPDRLCLFAPESGRITILDDTLGGSSWVATGEICAWSPDSTAIACAFEEPIRVRPSGVIRELELADLVQKAASSAPKKPSAVSTTPPAENLPGPAFTDTFDGGPSRLWRFQDLPDEGFGAGRHTVENGELVLWHSRACLDGIRWTNYSVSVRCCMKEAAASRVANLGIAVRATPSQFGSSRMDRYDLSLFCEKSGPRYVWLGINYADTSDTLRHGTLSYAPCPLVRDKWYTLEFEVRGQHLRGYLDGKLVAEATDARLSNGSLWIGAGQTRAHFDDFSVRQLP